jgi:hypothetical protein
MLDILPRHPFGSKGSAGLLFADAACGADADRHVGR